MKKNILKNNSLSLPFSLSLSLYPKRTIRQLTMVLCIDLDGLDKLIESLVDFVDELRKILNELIDPNCVRTYKQMVSRYQDEHKSTSLNAFPVPLMIIGCNLIKFSVYLNFVQKKVCFFLNKII